MFSLAIKKRYRYHGYKIDSAPMNLSIVIPVFEESGKIARDIEAASAFLTSYNLTGEIIVVNDGSCDGTAAVAQSVAVVPQVKLKIIHYDQNRLHQARPISQSRIGFDRKFFICSLPLPQPSRPCH
jgi:cellulose synthase/poly-beta-1,6-N-acetylglucosamine synthase-like glycosyltransferase